MTDLTFTGQKIVSGDFELQSGSIIVSGDVTAGDDITATDDITAGGDLTATAGNITATAGNVSAGADVSAGRHILATGSAPIAAAGAQAGTTPPAPVVTAGSNDTAGNITFGTGGTSAAGAHVAVTFNVAYAATPKGIMATARNTATEALGLYISAKSTTGFTLSTTGDSADSQANTVYSFDYIVIG